MREDWHLRGMDPDAMDDLEGVVQAVGAEENPGKRHEVKDDGDLASTPNGAEPCHRRQSPTQSRKKIGAEKESAVEQTPDAKFPIRTMP